jgi:hypothetical protein
MSLRELLFYSTLGGAPGCANRFRYKSRSFVLSALLYQYQHAKVLAQADAHNVRP